MRTHTSRRSGIVGGRGRREQARGKGSGVGAGLDSWREEMYRLRDLGDDEEGEGTRFWRRRVGRGPRFDVCCVPPPRPHLDRRRTRLTNPTTPSPTQRPSSWTSIPPSHLPALIWLSLKLRSEHSRRGPRPRWWWWWWENQDDGGRLLPSRSGSVHERFR